MNCSLAIFRAGVVASPFDKLFPCIDCTFSNLGDRINLIIPQPRLTLTSDKTVMQPETIKREQRSCRHKMAHPS
jgi:hypothetical protein